MRHELQPLRIDRSSGSIRQTAAAISQLILPPLFQATDLCPCSRLRSVTFCLHLALSSCLVSVSLDRHPRPSSGSETRAASVIRSERLPPPSPWAAPRVNGCPHLRRVRACPCARVRSCSSRAQPWDQREGEGEQRLSTNVDSGGKSVNI